MIINDNDSNKYMNKAKVHTKLVKGNNYAKMSY